MFKNYVPEGVMRKARVYRYEALIESVLIDNLSIATKEEIELAMRLSWVKYINTKELIMEMKQLKEFGKEVGLKPLTMGKMDEDALIISIIKNVEPKNQYSQEFIAWYESLHDDYFEAAETTDVGSTATTTTEDPGPTTGATTGDFDELIAVINDTNVVAELKEICKDPDFGYLFKSLEMGKFRVVKTLKEAMLNAIANYGQDDGDEGGIEVDDDLKAEMISIINTINTEDELIEFVSDETVEALFADKLNIGEDTIDVEGLKAQMLELLGVDEPKEEKPMSLKEKMAMKKAEKQSTKPALTKTSTDDDEYVIPFDPESFDPDEVYAAAESLGIPQVRKFAKQLDISAPPGSKKTDILELIGNKLQEMVEGSVAPSTGDAEVTVTKTLLNDAIAAGDKETLQAMCEEFGIKLSALQKKSIKLMGDKLMEVVPDDEPEKRDKPTVSIAAKLKGKDIAAPVSETQSIYQIIEKMVLDGADEATITNEVKPLYTEKGKTLLYIKKRVKQMIEIIKGDNDL
jgi:hypothetical protein